MVYIYPTYILQSITMVRLKVKVGQKGQILIPKIFREEYGIHEGEEVAMEPREEGLLLKGRPSKEEVVSLLRDHASKLKSLRVPGSRIGELKDAHQEMEYES